MQNPIPIKGIRGNLPILIGILNGRISSGALYRSIMMAALITMKVKKRVKLVTLAKNEMLPEKRKRMDSTIIVKMATHGVFLDGCRCAKILGRENESAMP